MKANCLRAWGIAGTMLLIASIAAAADEIGIYFDESASSNCLADNLFRQVPAYLIILEPTAVGGVRGWEGTLGFDEDLFVSVAQFYGNCINVGQFPEFVVGLAAPLPSPGPVVVARLSVFATVPGGLWFGPVSRPSIPGATSPIYLGADQVLRPMAPVSSARLAIVGYPDCGAYAELDSISDPAMTTMVFVGGQNVQSPDVVVRFPHGAQTGEFGYRPALVEDTLPFGVADFDIGADGSTYLLDSINGRVVVLSPDLEWSEEIPVGPGFASLKERNGGLLMEYGSGGWARAYRTKSGWVTGEPSVGPDKSLPTKGKTGAALVLSGVKISQTSYHIEGRYWGQASKSAPPAFAWDVHLARPTVGVSLAIDEFVHGCLLLEDDHTSSGGIGAEVSLTAIDGDGNVVKTIDEPTTLNTHYRLPFPTRVGLDGTVVTVLVFDTYTEVTLWRW